VSASEEGPFWALPDAMMRTVLTLIALLTFHTAFAQVPAPTQAVKPAAKSHLPPSAYCLPASAGFLESETKAFEEITKCARGDTIVIPARSPSAVARLCDFSKAVVSVGEYVVCVIVLPERPSK
jgi:hypothetical protein